MTYTWPADAIGDEIYGDLAPLVDMYGDPSGQLQIFARAFGRMLQPVDDIAKDGPNGENGWGQIFNLELAKDEWLFWLGQWVGYLVPQKAVGVTQADWSAQQRARIVSRSAHRRATIDILREVVQEHLNDPKDVVIQERDGSANHITVYIYDTQISDSAAAAEAAARSQKAAGLIMDFSVLVGADYALLHASNASYNILLGKHADYNSVLTNPGL